LVVVLVVVLLCLVAMVLLGSLPETPLIGVVMPGRILGAMCLIVGAVAVVVVSSIRTVSIVCGICRSLVTIVIVL